MSEDKRLKLKERIARIIFVSTRRDFNPSMLAERILQEIEESEEPEYYNKVMEMREKEETIK